MLMPGNFFAFQEAMSALCLDKHGEIGKLLAEDDYPEIEDVEPPQELDGVSMKGLTILQEGLKAAYIKEVETVVARRTAMESAKTKMFGTLMGRIGIESKQLLEKEAEWQEVLASYDPLALWLLIKQTHLVTSTGLKSEDRAEVRKEYHALKQRADEGIAQYCKRFSNSTKRLAEVDVEVGEKDQAADFLEGLDAARYGGLKDSVRANALQGIMEAPATLKKAMTLAVSWRVPLPQPGLKTDAEVEGVVGKGVFVAKAKAGEDDDRKRAKSGVRCYLCKGPHKIYECERVEEAAELLAEKDKAAKESKNKKDVLVNFAWAEMDSMDTVVF